MQPAAIAAIIKPAISVPAMPFVYRANYCLAAALLVLPVSLPLAEVISRIQSPSAGVGNWQVFAVTTATAGLFSPVFGLTHVICGDGGSASSFISMVRSSGM